MRIANSAVSMNASHDFQSHVSEKKVALEVNAGKSVKVMGEVAAIYEKSESSMVSAMEKYRKQEQRIENQKRKEQEAANARQMLGSQRESQAGVSDFSFGETFEDTKITLLKKILELLNGKKNPESFSFKDFTKGSVLDLRGSASRMAGMRSQLFGMNPMARAENVLSVGTTSAGTLWQRVTATSGTRSESEYTAFQSQGFAVTEDGRTLQFDVEFSMSRSFTASYDSLASESFIMTDPLIINLDSNVTSVSDMKFAFDLDGDGQREKISFAGEGSGFLALDVNGNGIIDDGSELFGTKTGDGFADLAAYDEDGNHWIDENDSVYSKLRVWTRDADGQDRLMDLKEANVGAIFLGSAGTEFSLNDTETNETNAIIRRTGIYLRETGEAGTISHVDLRC